jgi:hypothetical protein
MDPSEATVESQSGRPSPWHALRIGVGSMDRVHSYWLDLDTVAVVVAATVAEMIVLSH